VVRRIPIRAKVAGALAVPLVGLAAAAGAGVSSNTSQAENVTSQAELATASIGHAGLIGILQNEHNLALVEMLDLADAIELEVTDQDVARQETDAANGALRRGVAGQTDALRDDYGTALLVLEDLPAVRAEVDAALRRPGPLNRDEAHEVFERYTDMVSAFFASHDRFTLVVDDPELRQGDDLLHFSSHATDATAQLVEQVLYTSSGFNGIDQPVEAAAIARLQRDVGAHLNSVRVKGTGDYFTAADELLSNPRVAELPVFIDDAIRNGGKVDPVELLATTPLGPAGGHPEFGAEVAERLDARADALHDAAEARRRLYLGGAFALVGLALLIAWWVSRSITGPLRDLSIKARQIATYRLPAAVEDILIAPSGEDLVVPETEPIVVASRDEVADVAGAFNDVQHAAIGLAVEQAALRRNVAESYVNLGRRNQNLLGRLIDGLGALERCETDPQRLDQIRKLDHLATRIRRNADSLLVLSHPRSTPGTHAPVEIADVVRAALGEIENYERVLVRSLDPAMVLGGASADIAHLLAELIENGLRHSPPRELVEVSGRGTSAGYALSVVDHGLGMSPEDIERANQRLAGKESFTVTPAKYLGHYVAAVLAARHGIKVQLQGSVVVGIAALVTLPGPLLADGSRSLSPRAAPAAAAPPPRTPLGPALQAAPLDMADDDEAGGTPSAEDVREAVALLRSGRAPTRPTQPVIAARSTERPASGLAGRNGMTRSPLVIPDPAANGDANGGGSRPVPERTASGLVRRVRGAHVPTGAAVAQPPTARARVLGESAGAPSTTSVDGPEFHRFLTSLVGGVQRSLDGQGAADGDAQDTRDER
jgi:signal transduction histidine kinase